MSAPTSQASSNGITVGPIDLANPGTMVTSTIPTSINATTTGNGTHTHTMTMPTALANSASGLQPFLLSATTLLALGIAILAL